MEESNSRRKFIQQSALLGAGILLGGSTGLFAENKNFKTRENDMTQENSDTAMLNRFTGKTTQEHIHLKLVDTAKSLLWSTEKSISEIAFELGFEYPSHFTKGFKTKTGLTPQQYRNTN